MTNIVGNDPTDEECKEFYSRLANIIQHHTVGLLCLEETKQPEKHYRHIGSGSFVQFQEKKGILTAKHCTDLLADDHWLGLTISQNSTIFMIGLPKGRVIVLGKRDNDAHGPDLSFIPLTPIEVSSISIDFGFINIEQSILTVSQLLMLNSVDLCALCGTPGEKTEEISDDLHYKKVLKFQNYCLFIDPPKYLQNLNGFDYWECLIDYSKENNLPESFGGMSGGGLWNVSIKNDSSLCYSLIGVTFFQSDPIDGKRNIRCHGFESIKKLLKKLER